MAVDIKIMIDNLLGCYDFKNRTVISVGAGGGQLIEYGRLARKVFAIDYDAEALELLKTNVEQAGLESKFAPILGDYYDTNLKADVILFEFCLHEMLDPMAALRHAQSMAPDILIFDHLPGSAWAFITAEDENVISSWTAVKSFPINKNQSFMTVQFFNDYEELYQKIKTQGQRSIDQFKAQKNFTISLSYGLALL